MKIRSLVLTGIIFLAALSRLVPHPWNFTAIGGLALFGGSYFSSRWQSLSVPLVALFISDFFLGFHSTLLFVYGAVALIGVLGWSLQEKKTVLRLGTYALSASAIFFLISNFGVWLMEPLYPKSASGLINCYWMALPFLENQILGDLFYCGLLFGAFEWGKRRIPVLQASFSN